MASDSASATASAAATTTTTPTTASTSTASRRQSCDRCHGQKLRCTRASGSNTGACNRCLRQNARCVYSFSLPKGRPSMYRLHMANSASSSSSRASSVSNLATTATAAAAATSASASSSSSSSAVNQPSTSPATPEPLPSNRSDAANSQEEDAAAAKADTNANPKMLAADSDGGNPKHASPPVNINGSGNDDPPLLAGPMDTDAATTISTETSDMSIWSWLAEPFNWSDMQIDMEGEQHHDSSRPTSTMGLHQAMMDGIHQLSDAAGVAAFPDAAFPYIPDWGSKHIDTRTASPAHLQKIPEHQLHQQPQHQQQPQPPRPQMHLGPDAGIAQLSQLSMRLYPLHRTCCTLAETVESLIQSRDFSQNQILSSLLVDDATFKLVAQWLVQISADSSSLLLRPEASKNQTPTPGAGSITLGNTLLDAFSASCHLLEIMQCLQVDSSFWANGAAPLPTPTSMPGSLDSNTAYFDQAACNSNSGLALSSSLSSSSSSSQPSFSRTPNQSQYSNTIMRHLVIACHTLLLNIFVVVFAALQLDGDLRSSSRASVTRSSNGSVDPEPRPDAGLADIRLVMIVQLCSYLTERQCRAVHSYLSPLSQSSSQQLSQVSSQQLFDTPQHQAASLPASLPTTHTTSAEVIELEMEVRYRIVRLRQTLLI